MVYTRLRLGHTGLNATIQIVCSSNSNVVVVVVVVVVEKQVVIGKGTGLCIGCQDKEAVEHVLSACEIYNDRAIWQEMEGEYSIHDILGKKGNDKGEA